MHKPLWWRGDYSLSFGRLRTGCSDWHTWSRLVPPERLGYNCAPSIPHRRRLLLVTQFTTPEWVKDAVFYQIFPERFARSERVPKPSNLEPWDASPTIHGFKGGDLLGVAISSPDLW